MFVINKLIKEAKVERIRYKYEDKYWEQSHNIFLSQIN